MYKITISRMREERNKPKETKKISRKMSKKGQNGKAEKNSTK